MGQCLCFSLRLKKLENQGPLCVMALIARHPKELVHWCILFTRLNLMKGLQENLQERDLPGGTVVKNLCQGRNARDKFNSRVGKILWSRKWQPSPVFLPGKFHAQGSLAGYRPWGCKELDVTEHAPSEKGYWLSLLCIYTTWHRA